MTNTRCLSCRARHTKCTISQDQDVCARCKQLGRSRCTFESVWRIKLCKNATIAGQRTNFLYRPSQPWVPTNMKLAFISESGDGLENNVEMIRHDKPIVSAEDEMCDSQLSKIHDDKTSAQSDLEKSINMTPDATWAQPLHTAIELLTRQDDGSSKIHNQHEQKNIPDARTSLYHILSPPLTVTSKPSSTYSYTHSPDNHDPDAPSYSSRCTNFSTHSATPLTHREAVLIQYFIRVISPWLDVLQDVPRFAQEVPIRATKSPMLLFAVLAASSRHQSLGDKEWHEASNYLSKCLELVIQAIPKPEHCHDDNLLVTIVCLRLYELFGHETLSSLHLDGLAGLLSAIPDSLQSGGLAEAAAWVALRHDLFIAMMNKQAPKFRLEDYDRSSVFQRRKTPSATAYAIILIWAKILRHLYSTTQASPSVTWTGLEDAVRDWYNDKDFQPLFQQDANVEADQPFPIISMIDAPQTIALQVYYTCQAYLYLYKPIDPHQTIPKATTDDQHQAAISSICSIIGLARSNTWVEDANFPAYHILVTCGHRLDGALQRDHALRFLDYIKKHFGYRIDRIANLLKGQWAESDARESD
ncbi:hypothetical protein E4T48_04415 [Aureobasidium sp. EXF-10727]|nr:hypothetical protein E4T48_04415 [Aureobasidium sp. EXF-10727]KAI4724685.1 hypothetical protein E4T49_07586 [Aureobasidium sp. EXF-10728]